MKERQKHRKQQKTTQNKWEKEKTIERERKTLKTTENNCREKDQNTIERQKKCMTNKRNYKQPKNKNEFNLIYGKDYVAALL